VEELVIPVQRLTLDAATNSLVHFVSTSPKLLHLKLMHSGPVAQNMVATCTAVVDRFLVAAGMNGKLKSLVVPSDYGIHTLAFCLGAMT